MPVMAIGASFYWKASTTDLNAIATPSAGDRGIVITDAGAVSYWTYSGSAWVQAFADLPALGPIFAAATSKTTPVDADEIPLSNSQSSGALNALSWANLKAALSSLYEPALGNPDADGKVLASTAAGVRSWVTAGTGSGVTEVIAASTATLSPANVSNTLINNYGQSAENTQTLPTGAAAYNGIVVIGTAGMGAFHLKAGPNDKIYLDGVALDDGDKVTLANPAVGDYFSFWSFKTGPNSWDWRVVSGVGLLTDGGA
jgi:hypothetical protein